MATGARIIAVEKKEVDVVDFGSYFINPGKVTTLHQNTIMC